MNNQLVADPAWVVIDCSVPIDPNRENVVIKFEEEVEDREPSGCYILIHKSTRINVAYQLTFMLNNRPASHYGFWSLTEAIDSATGRGSHPVGHRGYHETERIIAPV